MPRPQSIPKLCHHKASGRAVVRLNGHDHHVGKFGTPEAKAAYDLLIKRWLDGGRQPLHPRAVVARPMRKLCLKEPQGFSGVGRSHHSN
ncbi:MAG: hypothetical protein U0792_18495 [Gemmataceae bacterium]